MVAIDWTRLSQSSQKILRLAAQKAHNDHYDSIEPAHLLYAILALPESYSLRILGQITNLHALRTYLYLVLAPVPGNIRVLYLSDTTKLVLAHAQAVARLQQSPYIDDEHLLLGLASDRRAIVISGVLAQQGATYEKIMQWVAEPLSL